MKKAAILLFFTVFLCAFTANSQSVNQKLITTISSAGAYNDAYSISYDSKSGGWVFFSYDTLTRKYTIFTPKGSSIEFSYANQYNALFDTDGNSYIIASTNLTDTTFTYSLLKNNEVLATYENIKDGWAINDGKIYFGVRESEKEYLIAYDTRSGSFSKSKAYDEVRLSYVPDRYAEGEPQGFVGFTKSGQPYYIARIGSETFLVIGDTEQKHYSDIGWYELTFDAQDVPCYIAKSSGVFYMERGNTFVVKGDKEYKSFDWIYGPIVFDNAGIPVYSGQDSIGEYKSRSTLMHGGEPVKTIEGYINNFLYSPSGKLAYVTSEEKTDKKGDIIYENRLVYDGKQSASYNSILNVKFDPSGRAAYVASDKNNKSVVVSGEEILSGKYDYISDFMWLSKDGFTYSATNYGNYEKKQVDKCYFFLGDESYGPYDIINTIDWKTGATITSDKSGNYAFSVGKNTDYDNYIFKYRVISNKGNSKEFDNISDIKLVNGKLLYFAGNQPVKNIYIYKYRLYINNKPVGDEYSAYNNLNINDAGLVTFVASKGNDMYWV
ncbi:MAG: hypothetical protein IT281_00775, partial [Ignavibacteria bacterium]|nr:hypothetical protein [Ignavibacteria bacterium]